MINLKYILKSIFWTPFFPGLRGIFLMLALASGIGVLSALTAKVEPKDNLRTVRGKYIAPTIIPGNRRLDYTTKIKTLSGEIETCNCSFSGSASMNCLSERSPDNFNLAQTMSGLEVEVLMSKNRLSQAPLCHEIRSHDKVFISYKQLSERYIGRQRNPFDDLMFFILFFASLMFYAKSFSRRK